MKRKLATVIAALLLISLAWLPSANADHLPSRSGYYYPVCATSWDNYWPTGQMRVYFDANNNWLKWWRYRLYNYPVHKNKNDLLINEFWGWGGTWHWARDNLQNSASAGIYRRVPAVYNEPALAGHMSHNNEDWIYRTEFVFDVPGRDPRCYTVTYPVLR